VDCLVVHNLACLRVTTSWPSLVMFTRRALARLPFFLVLLSARSVSSTTSLKGAVSTKEEGEGGINLRDLSDEELEAICTSRGFEVVREIDDASGEPISYSHDDFVDAARECLDLEKEMDAFFADHPELLGELHAETEKMMEEKKILESKLAAAQEELEKSKGENNNKEGAESSEQSEDQTPTGENTATPVDEPGKTTMEGGNKQRIQSETEEVSEDDSEIIDLDLLSSDSTKENNKATTNENFDSLREAISESGESASEDGQGTVNTGAVLPAENTSPLALARLAKDTVVEFQAKVRKDLKYLFDMLVPEPTREPLKKMLLTTAKVLKDAAVKVTDMAKRYFFALLDSAKKVNQQRKESGSTPEEVESGKV